MKSLKPLWIALGVYAAIVAGFETLIGVMQPANDGTLVITTTDANGNSNDRVLARLDSDGKLYVAANHWPRGWYSQALENPEVVIDMQGEKTEYRAVPVSGEEHDRVNRENSTGLVFRMLTGFPPRRFLRLDPR